MSDIRAKLRRLRREPQANSHAAGPARPADGRSDDLAAPEVAALAEKTVGLPRELREERNAFGSFMVRTQRFAGDYAHGAWRLDEVDGVASADIALLARDTSLARADLRTAVYLDIETTGLSGGAGTIAFMVALGRFQSNGDFELWQGFLRGPEEERAMLQTVAERVRAGGSLVSFFGKSFDRHRLEDKMRMHAIDPPFDTHPHLDLYHPLNRLYRAGLRDGRLATMERELCGVRRSGDLPGRYAPEAWFDLLGERAHRLEAVFRHNADDVLSLVVLAAHLGRSLTETRSAGGELGEPAAIRAAGLGRLFAAERRRPEALAWIERALERVRHVPSLGEFNLRSLRVLQAHLWRAVGEDARALAAYEELAQVADRDGVDCLVGLAMLAEHRQRAPERALVAARRAREMVEQVLTGPLRRRLLSELGRRLDRLEARQPAATQSPAG